MAPPQQKELAPNGTMVNDTNNRSEKLQHILVHKFSTDQ